MENLEKLSTDAENRIQHRKLASLIKGVHKHLRRKFRESGDDYQSVWESHIKDNAILNAYAEAMKSLATEHWTVYPESRIGWCYRIIREYFYDGGLEKVLRKDAKHRYYEDLRKKEMAFCIDGQSQPSTSHGFNCLQQDQQVDDFNKAKSIVNEGGGKSNSSSFNYDGSEAECRDIDERDNADCIGSDSDTQKNKQPILLLDVGSCYNPFSIYPDLRPLAIDICPAHDSVFECDFINLNITPPNDPKDDNDVDKDDGNNVEQDENNDDNKRGNEDLQKQDTETKTTKNTEISQTDTTNITDTTSFSNNFTNIVELETHHSVSADGDLNKRVVSLPANTFDVVVFCLLLEYLPSQNHRLKCCMHAAQLIKMNGLLIIVTPDSKSSYRNAPMMKSWRTALSRLGMLRWKYHKQQHLHCMAFRKTSDINLEVLNKDTTNLETELTPMLYIPQDSGDACYHDDDVDVISESGHIGRKNKGGQKKKREKIENDVQEEDEDLFSNLFEDCAQ